MGRVSKVVTSSLLVVALGAIAVPVAINVVPEFLPQAQVEVVPAPAVQLEPTTLSTISDVSGLSPQAPVPSAADLKKQLDAALKLDGGGNLSAYVADAATGAELYSLNGEALRAPASNLKILTAAAALKSLGAQTRLTTSVVAGSTANSIVLKGGGDAMLGAGDSDPNSTMGQAGLATLAAETAKALKAAGTTGAVSVSLDDTLFDGPALNPAWDVIDINAGEIAPVYPIALYAGRVAAGDTKSARPADPAMAAAQAFTAALKTAGVATTGNISRATAGSGKVLASVESATVAAQVQYLLAESDNYLAEVMGRLTAAKDGLPSSPDGARTAVENQLKSLGISLEGITMVDNCGLADGNLISAHGLVKVMDVVLKNAGTDVGQVLPGLPIAGLSGTLDGRFNEQGAAAAAGLVRAKTGTLNATSALTGYVINSHGRLLVFSIVANKLTGGSKTAVPAIDTAAAILAKS